MRGTVTITLNAAAFPLVIEMLTAQTSVKLGYPVAKKIDHTDDYNGVKVADPYRWLEDTDSKDTAEWVEAENKLTFGYLAGLPGRDRIKSRLTQSFNFE